MTLDELITWSDSQARRFGEIADEMEEGGLPTDLTVDVLRGRGEIHHEIANHLKLYKKMGLEADVRRLNARRFDDDREP